MAKVFLSPATLVGGSLAGALILALWLGGFTDRTDTQAATAPPQRAPVAAVPERESAEPVLAAAREPAPESTAAPTSPVQPVALAGTCPSQPLLAVHGAADGRFALEPALAAGSHVQPSAYVTVAREAAQQGRLHDAEVAWLAACHLAEKASGGQSVAVADLKSQLAEQYAGYAAAEAGSGREDLLQRAAALLSESAITYSAALGRDASKTRIAEQRLASLRDPATLQRARMEVHSGAATRAMGAAPRSAEEASPQRSPGGRVPSRLISSDPELSQLERDIERLRAQAGSVTRDPAGLRQRDAQAVAQRDARCQDKACLLHWYAQRREQLLDEF